MAADSPTPTKLGFIGAGIMGASRIRPKPETLRFFGGARKPPPRGGSSKRLRVVVGRRFFADRFVGRRPFESTPPYLRSEKTNERRRSHGLEPDEGWP
jgi:hypothetical protein